MEGNITDKKKKKMDWSLFISLVALGLSCWVFYQDYWKPFNLNVRASGRIVVAKNPFSEDLKQDCLLINLIFSNSGARRGVVEDVAVCIYDKNEKIIFRSLAVIKDRTLNFQKELPPPQMESFLSFNSEKYESVVKEILFVPLKNQGIFSFKEQRYDADIWAWSGTNWKKYKPFSFSITKEDIASLDNTQLKKLDDGSFFVKWIQRDKPIVWQEDQLELLKKIIEK